MSQPTNNSQRSTINATSNQQPAAAVTNDYNNKMWLNDRDTKQLSE